MKLVLLLAACLPALLPNEPAAQRPVPPVTSAPGSAVCGDLLQRYATRPVGVRFIGCTPGQPGGQTVATATYRVSGANSVSAEQFFHTHYGMAHLTFVCCGWEPAQGRTGQVTSARLRKLHPNYALVITMYSDAQAMAQNLGRGDTGSWRNRRQVKQFIVEVRIMDV